MDAFAIVAVLITLAALSGYINHRLLHLPATTGTLLIAIVSSLLFAAADRVFPFLELSAMLRVFTASIDFHTTIMRWMLGFLLFAGALNVDAAQLLANKWTIVALSTIGVLIATAVVGGLSWLLFRAIGAEVPLMLCFVFGALISPTDPIAVLGVLKRVGAPKDLEVQIAGESLFNDGVGVVVFFVLLSLSSVGAGTGAEAHDSAVGIVFFLVREVAGGAALGLTLGYVAYRALKTLEDPALELLITIALVMLTYTLSFPLLVSGPIAIVMAGLTIGSVGRRDAMSRRTRDYVDGFWTMADELLNTVLFLLLGLGIFGAAAGTSGLVAGLLAIPIALIARAVSVAVPIAALSLGRRFPRGIVPVLTWSGLHGGLSVAMVLSLPEVPAKGQLLVCTYAVVVFSILVQGLSLKRLLTHYGLASAGPVEPGS